MRWVTRDYVHLDRVASPWLIKRFVDSDAEFVFVPWGREAERPVDAIPFGMAGVELGSHDAQGTTFEKILVKYSLEEAALVRLGKVIACGVAHALHGYRPGTEDEDGQIAVGLLALSEGLILRAATDLEVITSSMPIYDALYANFKVQASLKAGAITPPASGPGGPGAKIDFLRQLLRQAT